MSLDKARLEAAADRLDTHRRRLHKIAFTDAHLVELEELGLSLSVPRREFAAKLGVSLADPTLWEVDYFIIQRINEIRIEAGGREGSGIGNDGDRCGPLVRLIHELCDQVAAPRPSAGTIERAVRTKLSG